MQTPLSKGLLLSMAAVTVIWTVDDAAGQALLVERLAGGTDLVVVSQPLADATTVAWSEVGDDGTVAIQTLVSGRLTLAADVEDALTSTADTPAPAVVVAVGGASPREISSLVGRVVGSRRPVALPHSEVEPFAEGGVDRHLGPPGSDARLRLELPMPPVDDWRRSSAEVLWELVPGLMPSSVPALESRVEGDRGILDGQIDAELAEMHVSEIRLTLAQFAADPNLEESAVDAARERLEVRRRAALEEHPDAARRILDRWRAGGEPAVREALFGVEGVTLDSVRSTARDWLPIHPGRVRLTLPPRVFNPRFAVGPELLRLSNDLSAAVLERATVPMTVVCLRPILVPDLDGEITATVLARVARELRAGDDRPGWIRLRNAPPLLEIAGPAGSFGELLEQLARARDAVAADDRPVEIGDAGASRRALDLMANRLGVTRIEAPTPASLLRPGNLAVGVVAVDGESAAEALAKFWSAPAAVSDTTLVEDIPVAGRSRIAAAGDESAVAVALDLPYASAAAVGLVTSELLELRLRTLLPDARNRVLQPFIPGRSLLVIEVRSTGTVDEVETMLRRAWPGLTAGVDDDELAPVKRRAAAAASAAMSGVAGHARHAAAAAAGVESWRQPAEFELDVLSIEAAAVAAVLARVSAFDTLDTTGAGVLPIGELGRR